MSFTRSSGSARICGVTFWLSRTPPVMRPVSSFETDLSTAVGPLVSAPWLGEQPSARGSPAWRPSGVAAVEAPWGTFAEIEDVPA